MRENSTMRDVLPQLGWWGGGTLEKDLNEESGSGGGQGKGGEMQVD